MTDTSKETTYGFFIQRVRATLRLRENEAAAAQAAAIREGLGEIAAALRPVPSEEHATPSVEVLARALQGKYGGANQFWGRLTTAQRAEWLFDAQEILSELDGSH
jgi:hypothetical protein